MLSADDEGNITLVFDADLLARNPAVVLSARPTSATFAE
jgi:hypothetical protein